MSKVLKRKLSRPQIEKALAEINLRARVSRDNLATFLLSGGADALPALKQSEIDDPIDRVQHNGNAAYKVTDLGRKGEANPSQAESIRLWVKQRMAPWIDPDHVAITFENGEVKLYHKA